jgi:hypothetical protein
LKADEMSEISYDVVETFAGETSRGPEPTTWGRRCHLAAGIRRKPSAKVRDQARRTGVGDEKTARNGQTNPLNNLESMS